MSGVSVFTVHACSLIDGSMTGGDVLLTRTVGYSDGAVRLLRSSVWQIQTHTVMLNWDEYKSVFCCKPVLFIQMFSHSPCKAWRHQTPPDCLVCRVSTGHWVNIKNICAQSPSVIVYRKIVLCHYDLTVLEVFNKGAA